MADTRHPTAQELEAGLAAISQSPKDAGTLEMIVRRPRTNEREVLAEVALDPAAGMVGDSWSTRSSRRTADGSPHPDMQLTLMNARVIALLAQTKERWPLAGDQLFVDLDLSTANVPAGTRLGIGSAVIEVTAQPHTGCYKFDERFGRDALFFVNNPAHKELRLRGVNARVVQAGDIRVGDTVTVIKRPSPHSALLIIDAQVNMFDPAHPASGATELLARLAGLVSTGRAAGVPTIFVRNCGGDIDPDQKGTPGWELHPALGVAAGDLVLDKTTGDAFASTPLDDELNARRVTHLVIAGLQSEYCIRDTTLGALARGYAVTLISDGHSTYDGGGQTALEKSTAVNAELEQRVTLVRAAELRLR